MTLRRVLCCLAAALVGCGGSGGATDPDAGPMTTPDGALPGDGATPTTPPFDPEMTYPGEGEACRVSLDCADRQICVDEVCRRHERYAPGELTRGEWRILTLAETRETRLYDGIDWGAAMEDGAFGLEAIHAPTSGSGELLYVTRQRERCEVLRIGAEIEHVSFDGLMCTTASRRESGELALGGLDSETLRPRIVVLDANGDVLQDVAPLEGWDELVRQEIGERDLDEPSLRDDEAAPFRVGGPSALSWQGDQLVVAFGVGEPTREDEDGSLRLLVHELSVFARLAPNGSFGLLSFDGEHVQRGGSAWLLRSSGYGLEAVLRPFVTADGEPGWPSRIEALALEPGGGRRVLYEGTRLGNAKPVQGTADTWRVFMADEEIRTSCELVALSDGGEAEAWPDSPTRECTAFVEVLPFGGRGHAMGVGWIPIDDRLLEGKARRSYPGEVPATLDYFVSDWRTEALLAERRGVPDVPDGWPPSETSSRFEGLSRHGHTAELIGLAVDELGCCPSRVMGSLPPLFWVAEATLSEEDAR